jgi:hypothetical protein
MALKKEHIIQIDDECNIQVLEEEAKEFYIKAVIGEE